MKKKSEKFLYINRDLSWLDFNQRILEQTLKTDRSTSDKLNFLAISSSNLDEFFMVRVASIFSKIRNGYTTPDPSGLSPREQMAKIFLKIRKFLKKRNKIFKEKILVELKKNKISFPEIKNLNKENLKEIDSYFDEMLFSILTPLAVDITRPFPTLENKTLNIVTKIGSGKKSKFKIIKIPKSLPRFFKIISKDKKQKNFILIENIIIRNLNKFFKKSKIKFAAVFRVTRDAGFDVNKPSEDLLLEIKKHLTFNIS